MIYNNGPENNSTTTPPTKSTGDYSHPGLATADEAARFLHISKAMVHKLIRRKVIPAIRYGRSVRIPSSWLNSQTEWHE